MDVRDRDTQTGRLLSLPAELRNLIYEYALTTTDIVRCAPYEKNQRLHQRLFVRSPTDGGPTELNQMKFACRQLYAETSILAPGMSPHVIFPLRTDTTECASLICGRLLAGCLPSTLDALRTVEVYERVPYKGRGCWKRMFDLLGMKSLVEFTRAYPHAKVTVYLTWANEGDCEYQLGTVVHLICLAARKKSSHLSGSDVVVKEALRRMVTVWSGYAEDAPPFPENLKIKPDCTWPEHRRPYWTQNYTKTYERLPTRCCHSPSDQRRHMCLGNWYQFGI